MVHLKSSPIDEISLFKIICHDACSSTTKVGRPPCTKVKPKKAVQFSKRTTIKVRPRIGKDEVGNMWYRPEEYADFTLSRHQTIRAVVEHVKEGANLCLLDPEKHCLRGLEKNLSKKRILARRLRTAQHTRAVLMEQQSQRALGVFDPISLQSVCGYFSRHAHKQAYKRALLDQQQTLRRSS
jgi:hypothetical protein